MRPNSRLFQYSSQVLWFIGAISLFLCLRTLVNIDEDESVLEVHGSSYMGRHLLDYKIPNAKSRCVELHNINSSQHCQFVKETKDCQTDAGFLQYIRFPYCSLSNAPPLAFVILVPVNSNVCTGNDDSGTRDIVMNINHTWDYMYQCISGGITNKTFYITHILWLIFLFILVGITADDYFCPALRVISDTLNLSPNVAGVTFLAYGNGAPDIFSAVAGFLNNDNTGSLALSALIGAGMFVTTVVVGAVSLSVSYDLNQRPYLRDVLFYLGALAWTVIIIHRKKITLFQAVGFIVLYVAYVLVVIIGRVVYQRYKRRLREYGIIQGGGESSITDDSIPQVISDAYKFEDSTDQDVECGEENTPLLIHERIHSPVRGVYNGLFTCSSSDFVDSGIATKVYTVIKIPIQFCLNLTIPVIELNERDQNWNKWLQVLQCIFTPLFCVFATKAGTMMIGGKFPVAVLVAIIGIIAAIVVALTSRPEEPPKYHKHFAFMAFIVSVIWIYSTANEIVNLLRMFGIVFKLSNEILGITLLAWGNSIADFIANLAVAKEGFPQMAIAACFGGPLLNLLLGVGLSCTIATSANDGTFSLNTSTQDYISTIFLAWSLVSSAIVVPLLGFRIPKWYGIYLIILYLVFLTLSILRETKVFLSF